MYIYYMQWLITIIVSLFKNLHLLNIMIHYFIFIEFCRTWLVPLKHLDFLLMASSLGHVDYSKYILYGCGTSNRTLQPPVVMFLDFIAIPAPTPNAVRPSVNVYLSYGAAQWLRIRWHQKAPCTHTNTCVYKCICKCICVCIGSQCVWYWHRVLLKINIFARFGVNDNSRTAPHQEHLTCPPVIAATTTATPTTTITDSITMRIFYLFGWRFTPPSNWNKYILFGFVHNIVKTMTFTYVF